VHQDAIERATARLEATRDRSDADAALERARAGTEALAEALAELQALLPDRVGAAVREGFRTEALPVGRQLAEVRGLQGQMVRRLEALQTEVAAERHARVDDLALLVELVSSGWRAVAERLDRLEAAIAGPGGEAVVLRLNQQAG
jgi:hypothetical protein